MATTTIEESGTHTRSVKYSLTHTWVIDRFSHFYLPHASSTAPEEYPSISSSSFSCSQEKAIQFKLRLHPKGLNEESQDYLSLCLDTAFTEEKAAKVPINFKLSILNEANKKEYSHECILVFTKSIGKVWHQFAERAVLLDQNTGLLVNDQLSILCEIEMYCESVSKSTSDVSLENLKSLSIAKNSEMYGRLLKSGDHSDAVLVLDGGKELKAHKNILSASSPVFKAKFEADMKEKGEGRVVVEDLSIGVAKKLMKFVYMGSVNLRASTAEELLCAADKYGLDLLRKLCGQYLCGKVATDNVARLLAQAEAHSVDTLKRSCMNYIRGHLMEVMLTPDWPLVDKLVIEELRQEESIQDKDEEDAEELSQTDGEEGGEE